MEHVRFNSTTYQNPKNPNYTSTNPYSSIYSSNYAHNPQNPTPHHLNPNPSPSSINPHDLYGNSITNAAPAPPGVDSYNYMYAHHPISGAEAYSFPNVGTGSVASHSAYYQDPNAQNWATVMEAARQYGTNPVASGVTLSANGTEQLMPSSTLLMNQTIQTCKTNKWKRAPKKTKIVQSLYCETCKLDCSSRVVYEDHVLGKKHKKNIEKLIGAATRAPKASTLSTNPIIGPQEKVVSTVNVKNKAATLEDLETKRRKVLEGGAAANSVRSCTVCNVVCNSDIVFSDHLSGQKHIATVNKTRAAAT